MRAIALGRSRVRARARRRLKALPRARRESSEWSSGSFSPRPPTAKTRAVRARGRALLWAVTGVVGGRFDLRRDGRLVRRSAPVGVQGSGARDADRAAASRADERRLQLDAAQGAPRPPAPQQSTPTVIEPLPAERISDGTRRRDPRGSPRAPRARARRRTPNPASDTSRANAVATTDAGCRASGATGAHERSPRAPSSSDEQSAGERAGKMQRTRNSSQASSASRRRACATARGKWGQVPQCTAKPRVD